MDKLYFYLFNSITSAIALLERGDSETAHSLLVSAQMQAEERYIARTEES